MTSKAIHNNLCDGKCGGVFECPQCKRLCGWCFGGAPEPECDDCECANHDRRVEDGLNDILLNPDLDEAEVGRRLDLLGVDRDALEVRARAFIRTLHKELNAEAEAKP